MNERIQELYKEATGKDWAYDFDPHIAEKFAELIIQECVKRIKGCAVMEPKFGGDEFLKGYNKGGFKSSSQVKHHFGIE